MSHPDASAAARSGLTILAPIAGRQAEVLTPGACEFLAGLFRAFGPRRKEILALRAERQREWDAGGLPRFPPETARVRQGTWRVPPPPRDLVDRRVEVTGPVDAGTLARALTSGAQGFMADLEDFTSPTWENLLAAQVNLRDAVRGVLRDPDTGRELGEEPGRRLAVLHVRPRGWHLPEKHVLCDGEPVSAALFDWGLAFFHNARELVARGSGPYNYLPKLEGHLEARLWNDVFLHGQAALGLPPGTIRATAMIETLPAAFEAEEILHELRPHALGLNCGRWDYLFSSIKRLARHSRPYPDRSQLQMTLPFLRAYTRHVVRVCHRRGAYAIGGMAAQLPNPDDPVANESALRRVRSDKEREASEGFDGSCAGDPSLVPLVLAGLGRYMAGPNQQDRTLDDAPVTAAELLEVPTGAITEQGVRTNLHAGIRYLEAWLGGQGCLALHGVTEDLATAEISRAQLWQWLHLGVTLDDGRRVTERLYDELLAEELARMEREVGGPRFRAGRFAEATELLLGLVKAPEMAEFLSLPAYERLP